MQPSTCEQADIFAFLRSGGTWTTAADRVEVIETHGAVVFMAGDTALKVKRAVRLPYLDFSTLEVRRRFCEREIEINRPHAPQIYRDVVPIIRDGEGRLSVNGNGVPVEWALRMTRFSQDSLMSHIVEAKGISRDCAIELAGMVSRYHDTAPRTEQPASVFEDTVHAIAANLNAGASPLIAQSARAFERELAPALERSAAIRQKRARGGYIRRCHGDLHLGNIGIRFLSMPSSSMRTLPPSIRCMISPSC